jgi:hypothetical protein
MEGHRRRSSLRGRGRTSRRVAVAAATVAVMAWATQLVTTPAAAVPPPSSCQYPTVPDWFHDSLVTAIDISGDLPASWADSSHVPKIACWQGADFDTGFLAEGDPYHDWHGIFAMATEEVQTIAGPWMISDRHGFKLSPKCFVYGWAKCSRTTGNSRIVQQVIAGLRWIWLNYGSPYAAWVHIVDTGRFNSYPRAGTDDASAGSPFDLCPVAGSVSYWDDFGQPRHVGGYHPHWGNDILAPRNREIRAPFDGLAVSHSDGWFAGRYVTVVGPNGYVRNGHLDRFGTLGYVTNGTVVGYVGDSGDADGGPTHDHFEWHPWAVPMPLHQAPSGFSRVMDAIDPFPFLNDVCTSHARRAGGPVSSS